jgi:hypothetical protein
MAALAAVEAGRYEQPEGNWDALLFANGVGAPSRADDIDPKFRARDIHSGSGYLKNPAEGWRNDISLERSRVGRVDWQSGDLGRR